MSNIYLNSNILFVKPNYSCITSLTWTEGLIPKTGDDKQSCTVHAAPY